MLPRFLFRLLRPPPFVHPCVPAPRLIPLRCGLSWLPCTSLQSHSSALGSGGRPPLHAVALSLRGQLARTQVFFFMRPRPGSGRLRPPSFVHPCVPAPRFIPPRSACHGSPARPCNPTAPALGSGRMPAASRRGPSPYADSSPGLKFFFFMRPRPGSGRLRQPLLCIHAYPRLGSSPCARASVCPAPSSGSRPQPRTPQRPAAPLFSPADLRACRRAAYARPRLIFCPRPAPVLRALVCLSKTRRIIERQGRRRSVGGFFLLKKAEAAY